ncbi:hypothetical protein ABH924_001876 [Arthrobacter sp. GAS37]|uniref:hypothetical protein n=1 Tax=Arthrobacter sp. GAS37 TaxID=3156261 RepID=UPI0038332A59
MTPPQISQFLQDSIIRDDTNASALDADVFYGLYVSWCSLNRKVPLPDRAFRTALRLAGLRTEKNGKGKKGVFQGLRMTGPAAVDYILNSSD